MADWRRAQDAAIARILARTSGMIARGTVRTVNDAPRLQVLRVNLGGPDDCGSVERFQNYGFSAVPLTGAEALLVFPAGVREHPVAIAVDDRTQRPRDLAPGDVVIYSSGGARVHLRASDGAVIVTANAYKVQASQSIDLEVGSQRISISPAGIVLEGAAIDMNQAP